MTSRVDDIAAAVIAELGPMEAMKLEKLVYYVQAWHVAITDDLAFDQPVEAWRDGPVVDHLFQQHKRTFTVHAWDSGVAQNVTGITYDIVLTVCGVYGDLSGDDLSDLTHAEPPWQEARRGYAEHQRSRRVIPPTTLRDHYRGRKLAGRFPSDLAVGGLHYVAIRAADPGEIQKMFAEVRKEVLAGRPMVESAGSSSQPRVPLRVPDIDGKALRAAQSKPRRSRPTR